LFRKAKPPRFSVPKVLIIHGDVRAVRMALIHCAFAHQTENRGEPYYLVSRDKTEKKVMWESAFKTMPLSWWKNAASDDHKLIETFQPIVDSSSVLVCLEGLTHLCVEGRPNRPDWERRARALGKILSWGMENLVSVIVGDVVKDPVDVESEDELNGADMFEPRAYGNLPSIRAHIGKAEGEDEEKLFIGGDALPLIKD
jgi:hypothetical protein